MDFSFVLFSVNITLITLVSNSYSQTLESQGSGSGSGSLECKYSDWSEWSECTQNCIDYDHIPIKYRTRKLLDSDSSSCEDDSLGSIQFDFCEGLPPCKSGSWIMIDYLEPEILDIYNKIRKNIKSKIPEWILMAIGKYPDIVKNNSGLQDNYLSMDGYEDDLEEGDTSSTGVGSNFGGNASSSTGKKNKNDKYEYDILKSVKRTSINQIKCGCPANYTPIEFLEFIKRKKLMDKLTQICEQNKYNYVVFEGNGRYNYYCNIGMIIKDVESDELTCDSLDSTEYVVCKKRKGKRDIVKEWMKTGGYFLGISTLIAFIFVF